MKSFVFRGRCKACPDRLPKNTLFGRLRNKEKGGFSKGGFLKNPLPTSKKPKKIPKHMGPSSTFGTRSSKPREAEIFAKPPPSLKTVTSLNKESRLLKFHFS